MTPVQMAEIIASGAGANVARDGFESEDLKRFSTLAAKMSIAFDELEPKEAGKSVAAWTAALGLDLERLEKMAGAINHFSDNSAANTGALTKLMTRQGAVIKAAGFNEIQATALGAAVLAANGNQAEMGATAAKNFALNMTLGDASSGEQKLAYKRLGFDPASISKQMNTDAVGTVHKVFERINQQPEHNRPAIVKQLFGKESIGGIMPLINNIDELRRVMSIANDKAAIAGSLDREFDKQRNTYSFGKTQLQSGFDAFTIAVGDELMPSATIIVNGLADMLKGGASFIKENKELAGAIIRASAAAAVIGTGVAVLRAGSFAMQTVFLKRNIAETKMGASLSATSRLSQWATTRLAAFAASIRATGAAATAGGVGGGYGGAGVDVDLDGDDKKSSRRRSRRPRKGFKGIWDRAKNSGGKVVKRLPVVGLAAGAGTLAYAAADENTSGRDMAEMAGSLGGAAAGAAIGSIIPGIGTIVGAIVGGIAGEGLGRLAGGSLFDWFTDEDDKKEPGEAKKQVAEAKAAAAKTETKIREVNVDLLNSKLGIENQIAHQLSRSNAAGIKPHSQLEIAKTTEYKLEFSPVITIHGDADKSVIDSALQRSEERVTEQIMQLGRKPRLKDQVATNFSDGHLVGFD